MAGGSFGVSPAALRALARRVDLWPVAFVTAWRMAVPGWWRRWPPRPVPDRAYLTFRTQTMFGGDGSQRLGPAELLDYLMWCRQLGRPAGRRADAARSRTKAPSLAHRRG